MKSTVVDESLSSFKPMYCSREYLTSTRLNQQYEKSTLKKRPEGHASSSAGATKAPEGLAHTAYIAQAILQAGSHAATLQAIASPIALLAYLPTVHPPISMTIPATDVPASVQPGQYQCHPSRQP